MATRIQSPKSVDSLDPNAATLKSQLQAILILLHAQTPADGAGDLTLTGTASGNDSICWSQDLVKSSFR